MDGAKSGTALFAVGGRTVNRGNSSLPTLAIRKIPDIALP